MKERIRSRTHRLRSKRTNGSRDDGHGLRLRAGSSPRDLALDDARKALEETKRELDATASESGGSSWNVAPPTGGGGGGGGGSPSPLSFKLRQQLKSQRQELEAADKALRDLGIEANLAGVPKEWRGDPAVEPPSELGQVTD